MKLKEKLAIVTGGERGIGAAIVDKLSEEGAVVVSTDIKTVKEQNDCRAVRNFILCDSSIKENVDSVVGDIIGEYGKIDILVNNAGISRDSMIKAMKEDLWDEVINVNLKGTFNWIRAVANYMIEQGHGRIVNISSIAYLGNRGTANYSASKAGINGLTRSAALELARFNITVNSVAPGVIGDTDMVRLLPDKIRSKLLSRIPSGVAGNCRDVANCVSFLVSEDARYINGQVIHVCGGLSVGYL